MTMPENRKLDVKRKRAKTVKDRGDHSYKHI